MHNSDVNLENARSAKPLRPSDPPTGVPWTRAEAAQRESIRLEGMKIAQTAVQNIGMSTKDPWGPPISHPQYALAVSLIFTKATNQTIVLGTPPKHVCSTSILWSSLAHDKRFKQVPMSEAAPGDIIIASHPSRADGYAGVVVDHGRIISNSSQGVQDNSGVLEIQRSRPAMVAFRYVDFWNFYRSKPFANAGFNQAEARIPVGQPGGGQWTAEMAPSTIALSGKDSRISLEAGPDKPPLAKDLSQQVRQILQSLGLPQDKVDSLAKSIDAAGNSDKFLKAFRSAAKASRDYSQGLPGQLRRGNGEAGFTVGTDGTVSPLTYAASGFLGRNTGALGATRPEPPNTALGVHSHFYGNPSYAAQPNTMGSGDVNWADTHNRPETAIGTNDITTYDPVSGKAQTMPLPPWFK